MSAPLLERAEDLILQLVAGDLDEPPDVDGFVQELVREAPDLPATEVAALQATVPRLEEALRTRQERLNDRLSRMNEGRRALRGYGCVRSHTRGQKLRKKA